MHNIDVNVYVGPEFDQLEVLEFMGALKELPSVPVDVAGQDSIRGGQNKFDEYLYSNGVAHTAVVEAMDG